MRWWESEACSTWVSAETRHQLWCSIPSRYEWNYVSILNWQYKSIQLMYVMATYSHGSFSLDIYIEVMKWLNIPNPMISRNMCEASEVILWLWRCRRVVWYNRLSELLLDKDYSNTDDCWCVFMKISWIGFTSYYWCGWSYHQCLYKTY